MAKNKEKVTTSENRNIRPQEDGRATSVKYVADIA